VARDLSQHCRWVILKLKNVATDDCVEGPLEDHLGGVAREERDPAERPSDSLPCGCRDRVQRPVHADNLAVLTNEVRNKEGDIAGAASDIEHAHPWADAGVPKEPLRDRVDLTCLRTEATQLLGGVTKHISTGVVSHVIHLELLSTMGFAAMMTARERRINFRLGRLHPDVAVQPSVPSSRPWFLPGASMS
jgi:hypothetical protein